MSFKNGIPVVKIAAILVVAVSIFGVTSPAVEAQTNSLSTKPGTPNRPGQINGAITINSGEASFNVRWVNALLPTSTGSLPLTDYEFIVTKNGQALRSSCLRAPISKPVECKITGVGSYTVAVRIYNSVTSSDTSTAFSINLTEAPTAPRSVTATAGNSEISVAWTAPTYNGGAAISRYTATAVRADGSGTPSSSCEAVPPAPPTCTIKNLLNGQQYEVYVTARNAGLKVSPPSTSVFATPNAPSVPPAPFNITAKLIKANTVEVSWEFTSSPNHLLVVGWNISVTPSSTVKISECDLNSSSTRKCVISEVFSWPQNITIAARTEPGRPYGIPATVVVDPICSRAQKRFTDTGWIKWSKELKDATTCLYEKNLTTNDPYNPTGQVTRAQMAAFLWRLAGQPEAPDFVFTDESEIPSFALKATDWLYSKGITTNKTYNPAGYITRAEMAAFLWRYAGEPKISTTCKFTDDATIPAFAKDATCWLRRENITNNDPYNPTSQVSRSQMALFLLRFGKTESYWL